MASIAQTIIELKDRQMYTSEEVLSHIIKAAEIAFSSYDLEVEASRALSELLGVPPKGWRSPDGYMLPRTYEKLLGMGYAYDASFNLLIEHTYHGIHRKLYIIYNDDLPYAVEIDARADWWLKKPK